MKGPARTGGGRMFRAVGRTIGAGLGVQEAVSSANGISRQAKPVGVVSVSSSSSSSSFAASASERISFRRSSPYHVSDLEGWETVEEEEIGEIEGYGFTERLIFGPPPSGEEVADAVATIQQTFAPFIFPPGFEGHFSPESAGKDSEKALIDPANLISSSSESESDWIEPALHLCYRTGADSLAHDKVVTAFRLLQTNPSIKRTVVSLSSDKAVWNAVMNNEAVRELRESFPAAEKSEVSGNEEQNIPAKILGIFNGTKAKMMEFIDKIAKIIGGFFSGQDQSEKSDLFDDALKSSFLLSVVVFIVVMISRSLIA